MGTEYTHTHTHLLTITLLKRCTWIIFVRSKTWSLGLHGCRISCLPNSQNTLRWNHFLLRHWWHPFSTEVEHRIQNGISCLWDSKAILSLSFLNLHVLHWGYSQERSTFKQIKLWFYYLLMQFLKVLSTSLDFKSSPFHSPAAFTTTETAAQEAHWELNAYLSTAILKTLNTTKDIGILSPTHRALALHQLCTVGVQR